jgi:hypothetical protein
LKVTIGSPEPPVPWSKFCSGSLSSLPSSATSSLSTNHLSGFAPPPRFSARTTTVSGLTSAISMSARCAAGTLARAAARDSSPRPKTFFLSRSTA